MRRNLFALALYGLAAASSFAAPATADVEQEVAAVMDNIRSNDPAAPSRKALFEAPPAQVLASLWKYVKDPNDKVRFEVTWATAIVAKRTSTPAIRQQTARLLWTIAESDSDLGNQTRAAEELQMFSREDFTPQMKAVIARIVNKEPPDEDAILLAGVADVRSVMPRLRRIASGNNSERAWVAVKALARLGDRQAIGQVIAKVEGEPSIDKRVHSLLGNLTYIRQPQAVEVLVKYLFSDEISQRARGEVWQAHAPRALGHLVESIEGLPIEYQGPNAIHYSDAEVAQARAWITQQGGAARLKIKR